MTYNPELIRASIAGRAKTAKACRDCARLNCPVELPESVFNLINTRRKLFNFLEACEVNIKAAMREFNLAVPQDSAPINRPRKVKIERPAWLGKVNQVATENEFNL